MMDGWMVGWMDGGVDKKHFFIIFYPHTNYPDASTYLPTYLPGSHQSEVGIRNCTKPTALRVSKLIIVVMKKSNTQFLSITMGLKKSSTQIIV
jgi:hypothetical protein